MSRLLLLGKCNEHFLNYAREDNNEITHLSDQKKIAVPFPYNGTLIYGDKTIDVTVYDAIVMFSFTSLMKYIHDLFLGNGLNVIGNPCDRERMRDKVSTSILFENNGIDTARSLYSPSAINKEKISELGYPVIGKPVDKSLGEGVMLIKSYDELNPIPGYIYQEYLPCGNSDERWIIVGGRIVCAMRRVAQNLGEFRSSIALGGKGEEIEITEEMQTLAKRIYNCFDDCIYTGADVFRIKDENGNERLVVGEANAFPLHNIIEVTGHNFYKDIYEYIKSRCNK